MSNGNSHFHLHCSWRFLEMGTIRCNSYHYHLFSLWSQCTQCCIRLHRNTDCIQWHYINIYSVKNSREWDHCVLCGPTAYSNHYRIFNDPIGWWVAVSYSVSSIVWLSYIDPPGPPSTIRHSILSSSANEANVTICTVGPPAETGGRDDLTYTVTISSSGPALCYCPHIHLCHCDCSMQCGLHCQCCGYQLCCWEQYDCWVQL